MPDSTHLVVKSSEQDEGHLATAEQLLRRARSEASSVAVLVGAWGGKEFRVSGLGSVGIVGFQGVLEFVFLPLHIMTCPRY